jgi:hypothetical protein
MAERRGVHVGLGWSILGIICLVHAFFRVAQPAPGSDLAVRAGGLFS